MAALTDDLLAYWSFEGNLHESINDFHGSPRGTSPLAFVDGQTNFGKALKLNGTNFVEITGGPLNGLDSPNGSLTIAGWFKVDTFDKDWQALIAKGEASNYRIARRAAENTIAYAGGVGEGANDTPNINDARWHHFAAVTDANTNQFGTALYIDGVRRSVNMAKPALTASTSRLLIGENPQALGRQWKGEIDDLAIWKRVLTAGEVSALYNSGQGAPLSTLAPVGTPIATLIDFPFDEGQGTLTRDTVSGLTGIFGQALDAAHLPVLSTNVPGGRTNDLAVSFNVGNSTNQFGLVVDDRVSPILNFPTNQPFTIETWINPDPASTRAFEGLVAYGRSAASNVGYKLGLNNGQLLFTLFGVVDLPSGIVPAKGEWHHVASVWRPGTGVEFFLDGVSVTNVANTQLPRPPSNNFLTIGAENVAATNFATAFQGVMDRVRVHRAALTAAQLDSVAATPKPVTATTVVSYNFDGGMPFNSAAATNKPAISSTPNNWPAWTAGTPGGQPGDSALQFAARQHIEVPNTNNAVALDPANPSFTMQAWVNFRTPTNRMVFYFNNGPGGALSFSVFTNRTIFVTTLGVLDRSSNARIPDDAYWHHIAVVHEHAKEFRFYVDGALADTQAYTGGVNFTRTNQVFYIGSEPTFGLQYIGGLDRLKVSASILTPDQLDFPAGNTPPRVVSVGALGEGVGVVFDRPVSTASGLDPANYTVTGTTVTNVTFISPSYVLLGLSGPPASGFSVTVSGVRGTGGDPMLAPATLAAAPTPGGTVPSGLMAHWSFDGHLLDSVNIFDASSRGTNPVSFANARTAAFGKSLKLNGTNYVEITGSSNTLQFANSSLSIAGWFKVDRFDKDWQALIAKGEASNYRIARRAAENTIAYAGGVGEGANDTPNINDTNWHHFVAVTDATRAQWGTALYIDGVILSKNTNAAALQAGTANLFIGENPEARNRNWVGEIDDVGLWNRVLAPEEVALLYNAGQGTPVTALPGVTPPIPGDRPYTVGLNFGAEEPNGGRLGTLAPSDAAGAWPQANWNNLTNLNGTNVGTLVASTDFETATNTTVTVSWVSNNTWSSTGRSEENNRFIGADRALMLGYLDTGNATTTSVTITNIPSELTGNGYDVYVYAMGGVGGRGGAYRVLDAATRAVLDDYVRVQSPTNSSTYIEVATNPAVTNRHVAGNFMVFTDLTAPAIIIEATTAGALGFSATPRAPINAIQLVAIEGGLTVAISRSGGNVTLSWTGGTGPFLVQRKGDLSDATWMNVATTASTSLTIPATDRAAFFRIQEGATTTVQAFRAVLSGGAEVPAVSSPGSGTGIFSIEGDTLSYDVTFQGMNGNATLAHIHGPAPTTASAGVLVPAGSSFTVPSPPANSGRIRGTVAITDVMKGHITGGMTYFNIHSTINGGGEIRGQLGPL